VLKLGGSAASGGAVNELFATILLRIGRVLRNLGARLVRGRLGIALAACVLAISPAVAADLPQPFLQKAPPAFVPVFNWTGFYIGGNGGWGWSTSTQTDLGPGIFGQVFPIGSSTTLTQNGWLAGAQLGYNYQINQFVIGVDADFDATGITNSQSVTGLGPITGTATYKNDWMSTLTARFGWAIDRALIYGKAGGAWTRDNFNGSASDGSSVTGTFNRWGWTVGGGLEYAVWNNVTLKVEYDYMNFGTQNETLSYNATDIANQTITGDPVGNKLAISVVKAGVNVLFH